MRKNGTGHQKKLAMVLIVMFVLVASSAVTWAAPKISQKTVTLIKGQTVTLKVTGTKKTVK